MIITIKPINFTPDAELKDYVRRRVEGLGQFHHKIEEAQARLIIENDSTPSNKVCEIKIAIPGKDLFSKFKCETFEEATNKCVEALEHQIKTFKVISY